MIAVNEHPKLWRLIAAAALVVLWLGLNPTWVDRHGNDPVQPPHLSFQQDLSDHSVLLPQRVDELTRGQLPDPWEGPGTFPSLIPQAIKIPLCTELSGYDETSFARYHGSCPDRFRARSPPYQS